jgi:hypothetical protein
VQIRDAFFDSNFRTKYAWKYAKPLFAAFFKLKSAEVYEASRRHVRGDKALRKRFTLWQWKKGKQTTSVADNVFSSTRDDLESFRARKREAAER